MNKLEELSKIYEDKSLGDYPFISKYRVTILEKGFYRKFKAKYRGISMIKDNGNLKTLLIGYYYVPEDWVIVPEGMEITPPKQKLINDKLKKGFMLTTKFPSLKPYEFDTSTEEYKAAYQARMKYKGTHDLLNNGKTFIV
tara:strand:- start:806 stop:1225 length:420 start_codon:yes stop_codon:yes gene_type:complete